MLGNYSSADGTVKYIPLLLGPAMFCHLLVLVLNMPGKKKVYIVCLSWYSDEILLESLRGLG